VPVVPDAEARRALLLILAVLERHGRALRALLARVGSPDLEGVLAALERRERALREAARQLRAREARETAGPNRRGGDADGAPRQGVLPLLEPMGATGADADAAAGVIPITAARAVGRCPTTVSGTSCPDKPAEVGGQKSPRLSRGGRQPLAAAPSGPAADETYEFDVRVTEEQGRRGCTCAKAANASTPPARGARGSVGGRA
jgi:hypothetical protein